MKRTAAIACLWAAMTGMAWGASQIDIVRARHDVAPDTHPNSAFWRGVPAVFAESDYTGDAVPGYRMEARSRWTPNNLYILLPHAAGIRNAAAGEVEIPAYAIRLRYGVLPFEPAMWEVKPRRTNSRSRLPPASAPISMSPWVRTRDAPRLADGTYRFEMPPAAKFPRTCE